MATVAPPVGTHGTVILPWLAAPLRTALASQRGHAILLTGPAGVGQFTLAQALAQAWLCETAAAGGAPADSNAPRPCGHCASCRLVQARSHPDLLVLVPPVQREALGWGAADDADGVGAGPPASAGDEKSAKRKPSKEIVVDDIRRVVAFSQTTSARGRGKVVVIYPAERMNHIAANTLLKTLEEPPGKPPNGSRFVLAGAAPDGLPPTVRSRCQALTLALPPAAAALGWLASHGVAEPAVLLAATGGQPEEALAWSRDGVTARQWQALPAQLRQGDTSTLAAWPLPRVIDALSKLCHDALRLAAGAPPRYFAAEALSVARPQTAALLAWQRELQRVARHTEHAWNAALLLESLVQQAMLATGQPAPVRLPAARGKLQGGSAAGSWSTES